MRTDETRGLIRPSCEWLVASVSPAGRLTIAPQVRSPSAAAMRPVTQRALGAVHERQVPAVLCLRHNLDRAQGGVIRVQGAGMGDQRLLCSVWHKIAAVADPEPPNGTLPPNPWSTLRGTEMTIQWDSPIFVVIAVIDAAVLLWWLRWRLPKRQMQTVTAGGPKDRADMVHRWVNTPHETHSY